MPIGGCGSSPLAAQRPAGALGQPLFAKHPSPRLACHSGKAGRSLAKASSVPRLRSPPVQHRRPMAAKLGV